MKKYWIAMGLFVGLSLLGLVLLNVRQKSDPRGERFSGSLPGTFRVEGVPGKPISQEIWKGVHQPSGYFAIKGEFRFRNKPVGGMIETRLTQEGKVSTPSRTLIDFVDGRGWHKFHNLAGHEGSVGRHPLALTVTLPDGGDVEVRKIKMVQYRGMTFEEMLQDKAWWTPWEGYILCLKLLLGIAIVAAMGAAMARRNPEMSAWIALGLAGVGVLHLVWGLVAAAANQSYVVWFPLVVNGGLAMVIFGFTGWRSSKNRREEELRRIVALDATV